MIKGFTVTCDNCGATTRVFNGEGKVYDFPNSFRPKGTLHYGETLRDNENILIEAGYDVDIWVECNNCGNTAIDNNVVEPEAGG